MDSSTAPPQRKGRYFTQIEFVHLSGLLRSSSERSHDRYLEQRISLSRHLQLPRAHQCVTQKSDCRRIFGLSVERLSSGPSWNDARGVPIATTTSKGQVHKRVCP